MKVGNFMRFKTLATIILSSTILIACNSENTSETDIENNSNIDTVEVIKNPSVALPVNIFVNSDYDKFASADITFTRTINAVSISDFTQDEVATFKKKYGSVFDNYNLDISKYKKLKIELSHNFEGDEKYEGLESFILDKDTNFVAGEYDLTANEIVNEQLNYLSIDYKVGANFDTTQEIEIAIPNEFISEHLQLKTIQQLDDQAKEIYINLVEEK